MASALAALGVPIAYAAPKPAKIGILAQLTGSSAANGEECVRGATLAVEEINKAGGIAGTMPCTCGSPPEIFGFGVTSLILSMVLLGGASTVFGPIAASFVLTFATEAMVGLGA